MIYAAAEHTRPVKGWSLPTSLAPNLTLGPSHRGTSGAGPGLFKLLLVHWSWSSRSAQAMGGLGNIPARPFLSSPLTQYCVLGITRGPQLENFRGLYA